MMMLDHQTKEIDLGGHTGAGMQTSEHDGMSTRQMQLWLVLSTLAMVLLALGIILSDAILL